mmetsp:Transcript_112825/g.243060  ORF Transcript_112825/g.243060 Transcript_112825/m.243060 type:complete len:82 (+) Transcript_112825:122-367(+)
MNIYNKFKSWDRRIMVLSESHLLFMHLNAKHETKKILTSRLVCITISPKNEECDILLETDKEFVYLRIPRSNEVLNNINSV